MSLGGTPARYNLVRSVADPSLRYGELIIDFKDNKDIDVCMKNGKPISIVVIPIHLSV